MSDSAPDPKSEASAAANPRFAMPLRRHHRDGDAAHPSVKLTYAAFADVVVPLTQRWVAGDEAQVVAALTKLAGADLYLASGCETDIAQAWIRLRTSYHGRLLGVALKRGVNRNHASELVDELLGQLAMPPPSGAVRTRLGTYTGRGSLFAYLATLIWRRHVDTLRQQTRRRIEATDAHALVESAHEADPLARAVGEEGALALRKALGEALDACTARERLVLVLKHRDGRSQKEIADLLGVGAPRVSRLVEQGIAKLQSHLVGQLDEVGAQGHWAQLCEAIRQELTTRGDVERPSSSETSRKQK